MSNRNLLERAAKASSFQYLEYTPERYPSMEGLVYGNPNGRLYVWNPLLNSDDSLLLSAALGIGYEIDVKTRRVQCEGQSFDLGSNPAARIRYAITNAASARNQLIAQTT